MGQDNRAEILVFNSAIVIYIMLCVQLFFADTAMHMMEPTVVYRAHVRADCRIPDM